MDRWYIREREDAPTVKRNGEVVRAWLAELATVRQLEDAARSLAPREEAWEALVALDALQNGRGGVSLVPEDWAANDSLQLLALELGVEFPEFDDPEPSASN